MEFIAKLINLDKKGTKSFRNLKKLQKLINSIYNVFGQGTPQKKIVFEKSDPSICYGCNGLDPLLGFGPDNISPKFLVV